MCFFQAQKYWWFSYFSIMKTYVVGTSLEAPHWGASNDVSTTYDFMYMKHIYLISSLIWGYGIIQYCTFNMRIFFFFIFMSPTSQLRGGGHTDFSVDPFGVALGVGVTCSCLHSNLWTIGWILTKFSWVYNLDITKNWFDLVTLT